MTSGVDDAIRSSLEELELFQGLQAKVLESVARHGQPIVCPRGEVVVEQGDLDGRFFVLLRGTVSAYRSEPGGRVAVSDTWAAPQWFGETSALSNQPSPFTVRAESDGVVLLGVDSRLFKDLYKDRNPFKRLVDATYRERALAAHLRVVPIFKGIDEAKLKQLRRGARLEVAGEGKKVEPLAVEGEFADAIYLVRSGSVKMTTRGPRGEERLLSFFRDNSSFGEICLARNAEDRRWRGTYVPLGRTDVVIVPRALVEECFAGCDERTLAILRTNGDLSAAEEKGSWTGLLAQRDDVLGADQRLAVRDELLVPSAKGGEALVIDLAKCTRCNACVESCVAVHEDGVPRLSKKGGRTALSAGRPDLVLASACFNCEVPECMSACNDGAIRRDRFGQVQFVWDNCTGCGACVEKCPYDVIRMTPPPTEGRFVERRGILGTLPVVGPWLERRRRASSAEDGSSSGGAPGGVSPPAEPLVSSYSGRKVEAKAVKCDLCAGLPFEACVYNCPCGAIGRVSPADLAKLEG